MGSPCRLPRRRRIGSSNTARARSPAPPRWRGRSGGEAQHEVQGHPWVWQEAVATGSRARAARPWPGAPRGHVQHRSDTRARAPPTTRRPPIRPARCHIIPRRKRRPPRETAVQTRARTAGSGSEQRRHVRSTVWVGAAVRTTGAGASPRAARLATRRRSTRDHQPGACLWWHLPCSLPFPFYAEFATGMWRIFFAKIRRPPAV